ncbi:uncharacterized protein (DUF1810 family) [Lysobacter niabensis]|uniref:Uncharacterized protein (DUF1810 family) n=1 Tax=Agrilutibacter niabensis TaxID=380628 RepID=A0ABU1VT11_9GAMM|nr:DUF1810 domain-containing protein [Lysobacter niabensis]MDR7100500.1 uncharacterized protein (DUF1810 family) [Lysobacter niabensis]
MPDSWNLQRFVDAQATVYDDVVDELHDGRKASHWMWFVFPQLRGLGHSPTAQHYGLASLDEARAYFAHPLLGERLRECTRLALRAGDDAHALFGSPDDLKFRSCMTLFRHAAPDEALFADALRQYFGGANDPRTDALLRER